MKKGLVLALALLTFSFALGRPENTSRKTLENQAVSAPAAVGISATPSIDGRLDDWAAYLSGLPAKSEPFLTWEELAPWQNFRKSVDESWASFVKLILKPMEKWSAEELQEPRKEAKTIFYPFGGPDFVTASAFFPGGRDLILMGLEPVGNLPDFEKVSLVWREAFFKDFDTILPDFLKRGYFVTQHMNKVFAAGRVDGSLPVILFFMKRTGCDLVGIKRLFPDAGGSWREKPYERLTRLPRRPYGIRIDYVERGGGPVRSVEYYSCDLENKAFGKDSPLYRRFNELGDFTTCIKSASYLMHYADFSNIRNLILAKSLYVIEDDTSIPYRYFKSQGWDIQLFGEYAKPISDFSGVDQPDLKQAYENPASHVKKLPFHYGYRWETHIDNLSIMKRPALATGASASTGSHSAMSSKLGRGRSTYSRR